MNGLDASITLGAVGLFCGWIGLMFYIGNEDWSVAYRKVYLRVWLGSTFSLLAPITLRLFSLALFS